MATASKIIELSPSALSPQIVSGELGDMILPIAAPGAAELSPSGKRTVLFSTTPPATQPSEVSHDYFSAMIRMMQDLLDLEIDLTQNYSKQVECTSAIADKLLENITTCYAQMLDKIQAAAAQQREMENEQAWIKGLNIAIFVIVTAATAVFLGPVAGIFTLGIGALTQFTNVMNDAVDGICKGLGIDDNPWAKPLIKALLFAAIAAIGAGASAASNRLLASYATEEGTAAAAATGTYGAPFATLFIQGLMQSNFATDLMTAIINPGNDPEKKKQVMWWSMAINIALSLAAMGVPMYFNSSSGVLMTSALAKNFPGYFQLSSKLLGTAMVLVGVAESAWQIKQAKTTLDMADTTRQKAIQDGLLQLLLQVNQTNGSTIKTASADQKKKMESLTAGNSHWIELTLPARRAAEILV